MKTKIAIAYEGGGAERVVEREERPADQRATMKTLHTAPIKT